MYDSYRTLFLHHRAFMGTYTNNIKITLIAINQYNASKAPLLLLDTVVPYITIEMMANTEAAISTIQVHLLNRWIHRLVFSISYDSILSSLLDMFFPFLPSKPE